MPAYSSPLPAGGLKTAYFRGRKLHGRTVSLPDTYRGVVAQKSVVDPTVAGPGDEDSLGCMEVRAEFDEIVVWGHEALAEAEADPYVRSVHEWLTLAEQVLLLSWTSCLSVC